MKYYISNNKINIAKYEITYTEEISSSGINRISNISILLKDEVSLENHKKKLDLQGVTYSVRELDTTGYIEYDGAEVSNKEEAEQILNPDVEVLKQRKIDAIKNVCQNTIYNGIDVTLSTGETKHFSLKQEDQININALSLEIGSGQLDVTNGVPYHADGEICTMFDVSDFMLVAKTASCFKVQQITYCNHLMAYVKSLNDISAIKAVAYGQDLIGEFLESYINIIGALTDEVEEVE